MTAEQLTEAKDLAERYGEKWLSALMCFANDRCVSRAEFQQSEDEQQALERVIELVTGKPQAD